MRIRPLVRLNDFFAAANDCCGAVWLKSPKGDKYDLKSTFSRCMALVKLLDEHSENFELFCSDKNDERLFIQFSDDSPEIQAAHNG